MQDIQRREESMITRETLVDIPLRDVTPNEENPRINAEAVAEVIKSIKSSDFITPIIVDENNKILAGNTRYKALLQMGRGIIPMVVRVTGLTEEQKRRYILADNKTQEFAEWDWEKLSGFTEGLLEDVGFTDAEIDKILNPKDTNTQVIPDVREGIDIKTGDLFIVGEHRLICGDSTDRTIYEKLMAGKVAGMCWTDPPYNVDYKGSMNTHGQNQREGIANDAMTEEQFFEFLSKALAPMVEYTMGCFYICMSSKELASLKKAFEQAGGHWQSFIIWVKNTFTLSRSDWQNRYEPIMYGWNDKVKEHYFAGWRDESNVWENMEVTHPVFDGGKTHIRLGDYHLQLDGEAKGRIINKRNETDIWFENKPSRNKYHPTEKPIKLIQKAMEASSHRGDIVLDPFMGGGSAMIAGQLINRMVYGIELDSRFCDVILRRMVGLWPDLPILCNGVVYDKNKLK
jgi:DNA modification methylase